MSEPRYPDPAYRQSAKRVYLRPLSESDASEAYAGWINDPEVNKYLASKSATIESIRQYIKEKLSQPNVEFYGIFTNDGDKHIGTTKLEPINLAEGHATIGILIGDKAFWGAGYGPEAMSRLMRHAFDDLGVKEVRLGVLSENQRGLKAYPKIGFHITKEDPASVPMDGKMYDQTWMVCLKHDFIEA